MIPLPVKITETYKINRHSEMEALKDVISLRLREGWRRYYMESQHSHPHDDCIYAVVTLVFEK